MEGVRLKKGKTERRRVAFVSSPPDHLANRLRKQILKIHYGQISLFDFTGTMGEARRR